MKKKSPSPVTLNWVRKISLQCLMGLSKEQLHDLQWQADRELFSAKLSKDWIDTAIRFQLWNEGGSDEIH